MTNDDTTLYRVTLLVRPTAYEHDDPTHVMDTFLDALTLGYFEDVRLDPDAEDGGTAVTVEDLS